MMQELDQDSGEFDLPDSLLDSLTYEYLVSTLNDDDLIPDPWLHDYDRSSCGVASTATDSPDLLSNHDLREKTELNSKTKDRRRRRRDSNAQGSTNENKGAKRTRTTGRSRTKIAQAEPVVEDSDKSLNPAETPSITSPKTPCLYTSHSVSPIPVQFITLSEMSPSGFIRLSFPNTTRAPAYILVPASTTHHKQYVSPLSPVSASPAPIQMSSIPPCSLSNSACEAMSQPSVSPVDPISVMPSLKDSPVSQPSTALEIPQVVKDYIQEAKAHIGQACEEMEAGFNLTSHYVDVQVNQRSFLRSGKNLSKCPVKELIISADTDKQTHLLELSEVFEGSKRYIVLVGNAGMGKTTLIKKLCFDWSRERIPQFDFVFLLDGKAFSVTEPIYSIQTLLLNHSTYAPSCADLDAIYAQVLAAPQRVLIIFDAFDELRDYETLLQTQEKDLVASLQKDSKAQAFTVRQLCSAVLQRVLLPGSTLLLSSRPRGTASQLLRRASSLLEVCGFNSTNIETYFSKYFTDPAQRTSALNSLRSSTYLHLLCRNPGLCRMVCFVLQESKSIKDLPRTLTGLCHEVICLNVEMHHRNPNSQVQPQEQTPVKSVKETQIQVSDSSQETKGNNNNLTRSKTHTVASSRSLRARREKQREQHADTADEHMENNQVNENTAEENDLLSQLGFWAWEGVKANSSLLPTGSTISEKVRSFGLRTKLLVSSVLTDDKQRQEGKGEAKQEEDENNKDRNNQTLFWTSPFLQSYMAAVHLSLSRTVSDRNFFQTLAFSSSGRGRRRPQSEEFELTQRFAMGLLFQSKTQYQRLHSLSKRSTWNFIISKQALVKKHLERLSFDNLSPAQVLEVCNYIYEASFTCEDSTEDTRRTQLLTHLAANLPEFLTFRGVSLGPPDVFTLQKALEWAGSERRSFSLDLEASGIQISGLRTLVSLSNINTYKACIADVITLWKQLEQNGEVGLLQSAVSKFEIHPMKAMQMCHIEHLARLVDIHTHRRLSDSSSQSHSILAEGVPAVKQLQKLEIELSPEKSSLALPTLWELLPGLHNLKYLDLENCKIGDKGTEGLAPALISLSSLQVLNLSQNCVGDHGVKNLVIALTDLPKLQCLSLYSNVISDEGAETLAAALPHMASLTDLDVKYNKLTDAGAQSLAASLKNCTQIKTLRMWNQCIPYGFFERLQQQDNRILCH